MAPFTHLDEDDARALAAAFSAGEPRALIPIEAGTINSNYRLETSRGTFFLRVNEGKREEDVRYEAELLEALATAGVPTPRPLCAAGGLPLVAYRSRYVSLFPWIEGGHRLGDAIAPSHAAAAGDALARLHLAGLPLRERFDRAGIYTFDDLCARFEGFRDRDDPALAPAIEAIDREIDWLRARAADRAAAPRGVIHGDLFPDNVLFAGDARLVALLDFEQASVGALVYDLAVCLNAWCFGAADFDAERVRAMVSAYRRRRPFEPAEEELLWVEARAAAMRFCITRVTDVYLPGVSLPGKDFRRYLSRLERWRAGGETLVRAGLG